MIKIGLDVPQQRRRPQRWPRRRRSVETIGLPVRAAAELHAGRHRRRHRLQPRGVRPARRAAASSSAPSHEVLIEESIIGWKEYEMEVMRDAADNVVIICSIENFDPMGVHTGDSITVAPAQTLTDKEYQRMRDASLADHPRDRRRDRRLEHPVRHQPRTTAG